MCVCFLYLMHLFDICLTSERQRIYFARAKQIPHVCFPFTLHPYVQHIIKKCKWNCVEFVLFGFCFGHSTSVLCSTGKTLIQNQTLHLTSVMLPKSHKCAQDTKKKNKWSRWKTWMCVCFFSCRCRTEETWQSWFASGTPGEKWNGPEPGVISMISLFCSMQLRITKFSFEPGWHWKEFSSCFTGSRTSV